LTRRMKKVDIVASNKVLSKIDDGHGERLFAVVMCSMFTDIPNQLADLLKVSSQFTSMATLDQLSTRSSSCA
jgi:hypothetical protein